MATFNTVATSIKTVLDALDNAPTSTIRKDAAFHPAETPPLLLISLGMDDTDVWGTPSTTGKRFQIVLTYWANVLGDLESNLSTAPDFWQSAKRALNTGSLSGVTGAWNVEIESREAWDHQPFGEGQEKSEMIVRVHVAEARNG